MKFKIQSDQRIHQKPSQGFRMRKAVFAALLTGVIAAGTFLLNLGPSEPAKAAPTTETLSAGSFIVNMGITPQTTANGLKPYGLIYDLIVNYRVPVKWIIEPTKSKDGTDLVYNAVNYKGGPFVIQKEFITPAIAARIAYWQTQGMQGVYTTGPITVPVYMTITDFPNIMIDTLASLQSIIVNYYTNAGIPATAYSLGDPAGLNQCHDVWTNPHGDPTWTSHNYLYNFVTVQKSFIWAECHSVSMMEGCRNPNPPYQQLNFLTSNGLQCWQSGSCGTIPQAHVLSSGAPYNYYHSAEPIMQFIGNMELCTMVGSERWYIPLTTGGWNASTYRGVTTGSVAAPGEGVLLAYGRAYGNASNGLVMYEAGHDLTGGGGGAAQPHKVSAQRAYFNFLLLAGKERRLNISASFPSAVSQGQTYPVSASVSSGSAPFTYKWRSSMGGSFSNDANASTSYTAPFVVKDTIDVIEVKVTDQCGKVSFEYSLVPLKVNPLPVSLLTFNGEVYGDQIQLNWITATEVNNSHFTLYRSTDGQIYLELAKIQGHGTSSVQHIYSYQDLTAQPGISYYRLSQTDFDGTVSVFDPIAVNLGSKRNSHLRASIYPNPFKDSFQATFTSTVNQPVSISISTMNGSVLEEREFAARKGLNKLDYLPESLPKGLFIIRIRTKAGDTQFLKILHQ